MDDKTLMWWERDERPPYVRAYPAIIRFLGREPWPRLSTLADALIAERRRRGLRIEAAATLAGVDEGTWRMWELGRCKVTEITRAKVDQFVKLDTATAFPETCR